MKLIEHANQGNMEHVNLNLAYWKTDELIQLFVVTSNLMLHR